MTWAALAMVAVGLSVAVYPYLVYPLLLLALRPRRGPAEVADPPEWPMVWITVPAYNEERAIADTLDCILAMDYPPDRRRVLVVSDASTDRTDEIVRGYADRGVQLLRVETRGGKTAAENAALPYLKGSIVVNTDASVRLAPDALKPLVRALLDPAVGLASGRDVSITRADADLNVGESDYVGYEMWVRDLETRLGSIVGASGCFYAIRTDLHKTLVPSALSRDFAAALMAREDGLRAVSVNEAVCFVPRIGSLRREFRRKVRTMTRGLETLYFKRHLMNPFRHGRFAWMLISHKLMRWLVPWGLLLAAAGIVILALEEGWARLLGVAGLLTAILAAVGWWWPEHRRAPRLVTVPAYVVSGMVAGLVAWLRALRGEMNPIWEPTRRDGPGPGRP